MPRRLLLAITLALLLLGSAHAEGGSNNTENGSVPPAFSVLSNVTVTCSARLPATVVGCFVERPVLVLGDFELALGIDAQAALTNAYTGHLAPYAVLAYYGEALSAWVEVRLPELAGLQPLGDPDWLRLGFSLTL